MNTRGNQNGERLRQASNQLAISRLAELGSGEPVDETRDFYLNLFDEFPCPIWRSGVDAKCNYFNRAWLELTGRTMEQELGDGWAEGIHPDDLSRCLETYLAAFDARQAFEMEYRLRAHDGEYRSIFDFGRAFYDVNESFSGYVGVCFDVTEHRRAEESLTLFRSLLDRSSDAIEVIDPDTLRFLDCNESACRSLGYSREEFLSLSVLDIDPEVNEASAKAVALEMKRSGFAMFESAHRRKDGSIFPVEVNVKEIQLERAYRLAIVRDITERRQARDDMQTYARRLIEVHEEERQKIARELHDEIGQILTAMRLNVYSMKQVTEKQAVVERAVETLSMIDQTLDRVRDLSLSLRPALLDDLGLAAALRWYLERYHDRTGIEPILTARDLENDDRLDRDLEIACFRIVQEGLTNTARHARAENVRITVARWKDALSLTIQDDGVGFDPAILLTRDGGGATLGLRGMDERARALNGKFMIESAHSQGTTIRVSFPINAAEKTAMS